MSRSTYVRYEVLRTIRNRRFLIFSLIFPLILFLTIAGENRHVTIDGITLSAVLHDRAWRPGAP